MADITKIRLESGDYDIKDATARSGITSLNTRVDNVETEVQNKTDLAEIKFTQNMIYNQSSVKHFQGCCVGDNNTLYQYEDLGGQNGNLYLFNITNHTYTSSIQGVPLYHGNSLEYKDGYIYAAACLNGSTATNKIVKYNLSTGVAEELTPFTNAFISKTIAVCNYDDKLFVCGALNEASVQLGGMNFALLNSDNTYTAYTLVNPNHYNISSNVVQEMVTVNGKIYIITDGDKLLFELAVDEENHTLTIVKVNRLSNLDDLGLEIGEIEGMSTVPSGYLGEDTLIVTSFMFQNTNEDSCSLYVYNINLNSDVPQYAHPVSNQYYPRKFNYVYVKKAGGDNLIEDGTTTHPFTTINRAIEFVNAAQARGIAIAEIQMLDGETYTIGNLAQTNAVINCSTYTPTFYIGNLYACNISISAGTATNATVYKTSSVSNVFLNYGTQLNLTNVNVASTFYMSRGSRLYAFNLTISASAQDWMTMTSTSFAQLKVVSAANITRNVVNNREGSLLLINSGFANKVYTDGGSSKITGTD